MSRVTFCSFMLGEVVILHLQCMDKASRQQKRVAHTYFYSFLMQYGWISDTNVVLMLVYFHAPKTCLLFNYLLFSSRKVRLLKKFETENVFQETAEIFEDETATSEEIIEAGLIKIVDEKVSKFNKIW